MNKLNYTNNFTDIEYIKNYFLNNTKHNTDITYIEYNESNHYICYMNTHTVARVSAKKIKDTIKGYSLKDTVKTKLRKHNNSVFLFISNASKWKSESILSTLSSAIEAACSTITSCKNYAVKGYNSIHTLDFKLFLVDILAILMEARDGYLTSGKIFSLMLSIFTSYHRFKQLFVPQVSGFSELAMGFACLGLPQHLVDMIKNFTVITGKRVFDNNIIYSTVSQFGIILRGLLTFLNTPFEGLTLLPNNVYSFLLSILDKLFSTFDCYTLMQEIVQIYTIYVQNPQKLFDPTFREQILKLEQTCINTNGFLEYANNVSNRFFNATWVAFRDTVVKSTKAFSSSKREEPICFVFEGGAGSGKSTFMNMVVDLLRADGRSVYCHTVPSTEDSKDFYDDYENQEVFVMDDVGQQGKSQWRTIINYVSPVIYPLPCATASKKNTKSFNSKIILCTTNHLSDLSSFTSSDCISEPSALFRRIHLVKVDKNICENFSQTFSYHKYAHLDDKKWRNEFLYQAASAEVPVSINTDGIKNGFQASLAWFWRVFKHIEKTESDNNNLTTLPLSFFKNILDNVPETYEDAFESQSFIDELLQQHDLYDYKLLFEEWLEFMIRDISFLLKWISSQVSIAVGKLINGEYNFTLDIPEYLGGGNFKVDIHIILIIMAVVSTLAFYFISKGEKYDIKRNFLKCKENVKVEESAIYKAESDRVDDISKFMKTVVIRQDRAEEDETVQAIVSGKYIILPSHVCVTNRYIDIYTTYDHFLNKHKELEGIQLKEIRNYFTIDLAVYEILSAIPLYKKCWNLFPDGVSNNPNMFLINSIGKMPVNMGISLKTNDMKVTYSRYTREGTKQFSHEIGSGIITPLSGAGLCGTVLVTSELGIVGYHVAGTGINGFCVVPPQHIREDIRSIVLEGVEPKFDIDTKVIPNFSGVRLRYPPGSIKMTRAMGETSFAKSVFHTDNCLEMRNLCQTVYQEKLTPIPCEVDSKVPPNFRADGTPAQTLKNISLKTFKHQGLVKHEEMCFLEKYVRTLFIAFDDIEDQECAFGGKYCNALNKDSSNGYGCASGKDYYFDFENKRIREEAHDLFLKFKVAAYKEDYDYDNYLCRETFKDELRGSTKANTPRTFRVMPLPHIWWTKKTCAKLMPHFKEKMHNFGCGVGLNPYIDSDIIAKKLLLCHTTGDIDFKQWDGSVMGPVMSMISRVMLDFYIGPNKEVLKYLLQTATTSIVLINDEVWATTHGLPSGTWLTLLLNCIINKCITALTIYRNKEEPTVQDVHDVVDYVVGDDKIFGVPEKLSKVFNLKTIEATALSLGMTCTNGDKTKITKESQEFHKLSFVKRHFVQHPTFHKYVGVLSIDTILNTLQWVNTTKDIGETMEGKMRSVQVEAYLHSPALFNRLTQIMRNSFPYAPLFDEQQVIKILTEDKEGYITVMKGLGKDISYLFNC